MTNLATDPRDPADQADPADPRDATDQADPADPRDVTDPRAPVESLRSQVNHLFAADRRLRGRDHSRPGELTHAQLRTIATLGREAEMTAGQLARSAELTPATVTAILDQLEGASIIVRSRSTSDRRVCNVSLTPEGWAILERKLTAWRALWADALAEFSDEEIDTAARVIGRATEALDALNRKLEHQASAPDSSSTPRKPEPSSSPPRPD